MKPDEDRYLRAALQEYDNIAKLGHIIREGPIKVSAPDRLLPRRMQGAGNSFLHRQAQLDLASTEARPPGQQEGPGPGANQKLLQPVCP